MAVGYQIRLAWLDSFEHVFHLRQKNLQRNEGLSFRFSIDCFLEGSSGVQRPVDSLVGRSRYVVRFLRCRITEDAKDPRFQCWKILRRDRYGLR